VTSSASYSAFPKSVPPPLIFKVSSFFIASSGAKFTALNWASLPYVIIVSLELSFKFDYDANSYANFLAAIIKFSHFDLPEYPSGHYIELLSSNNRTYWVILGTYLWLKFW